MDGGFLNDGFGTRDTVKRPVTGSDYGDCLPGSDSTADREAVAAAPATTPSTAARARCGVTTPSQ